MNKLVGKVVAVNTPSLNTFYSRSLGTKYTRQLIVIIFFGVIDALVSLSKRWI